MKTKTFYVMDDDELNELIQEALNKKYSFMADMDIGNDSDSAFMDINGDSFYDYERNDLERFRSCGEGKYLARLLLKYLVAINKLKSGNYLIRVCY